MQTTTPRYTKNRTDPNPVMAKDPSGHGPVALREGGEKLGLVSYRPPGMGGKDLSPTERIENTWWFFTLTGGAELLGHFEFQRWLNDTMRVDPVFGSEWWMTVNGQVVSDQYAALMLIRGGVVEASTLDPGGIRAWMEYAEAVTGGANAEERQRLYWRAHQVSLHEGIRKAEPLLGLETRQEQAFIEIVVENVDLSALINFPTRSPYHVAMKFYLRGVYGMGPPTQSVRDMTSSSLKSWMPWAGDLPPGTIGTDSILDWYNLGG